MLYSQGPGSGREVFRPVWPQMPPAPTSHAAQPLPAASGQPPLLGGLQGQDTFQPQARTWTQLHVHVPREAEHQP